MSVNLIPPEAFISVVAFLEMAQISNQSVLQCAVCGAAVVRHGAIIVVRTGPAQRCLHLCTHEGY